MNVSSYLEGFLTVYGWMMYDTLYQLFSMLWLIFLPFLMLFYNFLRDTVTDNSHGGYGHFKSTIWGFIMMLLIVFTCLVPIDKISIKDSKLNTVCNKAEQLTAHYKPPGHSSFRFDVESEGKIPLLVSIVMRISQGTNNVIYRTMDCAPKVTNLALAYDSSKIQSPDLKDEMGNFVRQCYRRAKNQIDSLERHVSSKAKAELAEHFAKAYVTERGGTWRYADKAKEIRFQEMFLGSDFLLYMMDPGKQPSVINSTSLSADEIKAFKQMNFSPIFTQTDVADVKSTHPNRSKNQTNISGGPVACTDWWSELRPKLEEDALTDLTKQTIAKDESQKCKVTTAAFTSISFTASVTGADAAMEVGNCPSPSDIKQVYKITDQAKFEHTMNGIMLNSQYTATGSAVLEQKDRDLVTAGILTSVIGFIPGVPAGISSFADSAASFYAEMFMYKVIAKFLQPMLLMGIYGFWIIYLIVSSYRGDTVFRGLVLIFAISVLPSIWAVADYLDSYLYQAMYPFGDVVTGKRGSSIERMVLDAASTAFYVIFPFILLYLISEAGGPRADRAMNDTQAQAGSLARTSGGAVGNTAGRTAGAGQGYINSKFGGRKSKGKG